jgi:1-acyl-sn-glycerol-3-phosphate acyltransferase
MSVLRSLVFNVSFFVLTFVVTLLATLVRPFGWKPVVWFGTLWSRSLLLAARVFCGIRLRVEGLEHLPPGGVVIASRHQSAFDTFVWLSLVPHCCYVLKHELKRVPLFGGLIKDGGMIAIDRRSGGAALRTLLRGGAQAARQGRQIVIFPEGTRSPHGKPRPLQPGVLALAAKTGLPVVPVATDSGLCWGRRAFRKKAGTIRILIGRPIPADTERRTLMRMLEAGMSALDVEAAQRPHRSAA